MNEQDAKPTTWEDLVFQITLDIEHYLVNRPEDTEEFVPVWMRWYDDLPEKEKP